MKANRITAIGEKLEQTDVATPVPGAGEVLVAVKAAGILPLGRALQVGNRVCRTTADYAGP